MVSPTIVQRAVADYFQITIEQLRTSPGSGRQRTDRIEFHSTARHIARYLERTLSGLTYMQIGEFYGTDHTSALASVRHMKQRLSVGDARYAEHVRAIQERLGVETQIPGDAKSFSCPTCGSPVITELRRQVAILSARLEEVEKR